MRGSVAEIEDSWSMRTKLGALGQKLEPLGHSFGPLRPQLGALGDVRMKFLRTFLRTKTNRKKALKKVLKNSM